MRDKKKKRGKRHAEGPAEEDEARREANIARNAKRLANVYLKMASQAALPLGGGSRARCRFRANDKSSSSSAAAPASGAGAAVI
jgi:hypothetical protein